MNKLIQNSFEMTKINCLKRAYPFLLKMDFYQNRLYNCLFFFIKA